MSSKLFLLTISFLFVAIFSAFSQSITSDKVICESAATLSAGTVQTGTGIWTCNIPDVVIASPSSFQTQVSGLKNGSNVFTWTFTSQTGVTTQKNIVLSYYVAAATAGADKEICSNATTLTATLPTYGEGRWGLASGGGTIANKSLNNTDVTDLRPATNVFRWLVTNNNCTAFDDLVVVNNSPSVPAAMAGLTLCVNQSSLIAQTPDIGIGRWVVHSGTGNIANASIASTSVSNLGKGSNVFRWTITQGNCSLFKDVELINYATEANAGVDVSICEDFVTLFATKPTTASGAWSIASGYADFSNVNSTNPNLTNLKSGNNTFRWTVTENDCTATDEVTIANNAPSQALVSAGSFLCTNSTQLKAVMPTIGSGKWTIAAGGGLIANSLSPITTVSNIHLGDNTFRWTVTFNGCSSFDDMEFTNNTVFSSTGTDQVICTNFSLISAQYSSGASGAWSLVSGIASIGNMLSAETTVTNLGAGNNVFRWTVTGDGCTATDDVVVTNNRPTTASAMQDLIVCQSSVNLYGNQPLQGTGAWSFTKGSGSFISAVDYNTIANNLATGENIIRWTITKGDCTSFDDVLITNKFVPSNAGTDDALCGTVYDLKANTPPSGSTGTWTVVSGRGSFADKNLYNTRVANLLAGLNTFRWTVVRDNCSSVDDVMITNNQISTFAGDDKMECTDESFLSATVPTNGTGHWVATNNNAIIENTMAYITNVRNLSLGENIFRWIIENQGCTAYDEMSIINYSVRANAGADIIVCSNVSINLSASSASNGVGVWSIKGGLVKFDNINSPTALLSEISSGSNTLRWTVKNQYCEQYDDVIVSNNQFFVYLSNSEVSCGGSYQLSAPDPGSFATGVWTVEDSPASIESSNSIKTMVNGLRQGNNIFRWTVTQKGCSDSKTINIMNNFFEAYAGSDATVCQNRLQLNGTLSAEALKAGVKGYWSILSGGALFTAPSNIVTTKADTLPNPLVTNMIQGRNIFRWTISLVSPDRTCSAYDNVEVINNTAPVSAGKDQFICVEESFMNAAMPPSEAKGYWTSLSSNLLIQNTLNPTTKISNLNKGENLLLWTVEYKGCVSVDSLMITNNSFTVSAGNNQDVVNETGNATISASPLTEGASGTWSLLTGRADFSCGDKTKAQTNVCNLGSGQNVLRWTVYWKNCNAYSDVLVNYISPDMMAKVYHAELHTCNDSIEVAAIPPRIGDKKWKAASYLSFKNDTLTTTWVYNLKRGKNLVYWTVTKNNVITKDSITIYNNSFDINAGVGLQSCDVPLQLNAQTPLDETYVENVGEWVGYGTFSNINDPKATVRGLWAGDNELMWRVKRRKCTTCNYCIASDTLHIYYTPPQDFATVLYNDIVACTTDENISAYQPMNSTGKWSVVLGTGIVQNPDAINTKVTNLTIGRNLLRWTVKDKNCTTYDTVQIVIKPVSATADITHVNCSNDPIGKIQLKPTGGTGNIKYQLGEDTGYRDNDGLFTNLGADVYKIWAIDDNYCVSYLGEFEVKGQGGLDVGDVKFLGFDNNDTSKGRVEIVVENGKSPYSYQIGDVVQSNPVFMNLGLGEHIVWIQDANGCRIYDSFVLTNEGVGIDDVSMLHQQSGFEIYPNPVENLAIIKLKNRTQGVVCIEVYDLMGKKHEQVVNRLFGEGEFSLTWNSSTYSSGVYFIKLITAKEVVYKTVVVQK